MNEQLLYLASRIRDELSELERISQRVAEGWNRALKYGDDYYLDSVALNLHGCYGGLERIFELIAAVIDSDKAKGRALTSSASGADDPGATRRSTGGHFASHV